MATTCSACGRICETRYTWAHHGCERIGAQREANRHRSVLIQADVSEQLIPLPAAPVRALTLREATEQALPTVLPAQTPAVAL